jgi:hypothetical protein
MKSSITTLEEYAYKIYLAERGDPLLEKRLMQVLCRTQFREWA